MIAYGNVKNGAGMQRVWINYAFGRNKFTRKGKNFRNSIKRVSKITTFKKRVSTA
jgi:hypothetical protein